MRPPLTSLVSQASLTGMKTVRYSDFTWHTPRPGHKAEHLAGKPRPEDELEGTPIRQRAGFTWQVSSGEILVPFAAVIGRRYSADAMDRMRLALREFERTETTGDSELDLGLPEGAELVAANIENP